MQNQKNSPWPQRQRWQVLLLGLGCKWSSFPAWSCDFLQDFITGGFVRPFPWEPLTVCKAEHEIQKSGCCSAENWWSCVQEGGEGHPTAAAHLTPNSKFHSVQTLQLSSPSFDTWVRSEAAEHPPAGTRVTLAAPTGAGQSPHRAVMSWMLLECSFIRPKTLSRQESCGRPRYRVLSSKTIWKLLLI